MTIAGGRTFAADLRARSAPMVPGQINLGRDLDMSNFLFSIQRRGVSDENSIQSCAVDETGVIGGIPGRGILYTLHEATGGTVGVVSRVPFDESAPTALAAVDAMNASTLIGHQGIDVWHLPDGTPKLLATSRANGRDFVMGSYVPNGDFVSDGTWQMFGPEWTTSYTMPKLSADGALIACRAKYANGDTLVRVWSTAILSAPGDYSSAFLREVRLPLADFGVRPLQDIALDGASVIALAGYGAFAAYDATQRTQFTQYWPDGRKIAVRERDFAEHQAADAAGEVGNCEPESLINWQANDGSPRMAVVMSNGKNGFRLARGYTIGWRKRWEAETQVAKLQAAIVAIDPAQRLTFEQQAILASWYRDMINDRLFEKWGAYYATCGRGLGLGEAFSRINLIDPGRNTLVLGGTAGDPFTEGYYRGNGTDRYLNTGIVIDYAPAHWRKHGTLRAFVPRNESWGGGLIGSNPAGAGYSYFSPRRTGGDADTASIRSQTTVDTIITGVTDSSGAHSIIRRVESEFIWRRNAANVAVVAQPTTGTPGFVSGTTICFGCSSTTYTQMPLALAGIGEQLSDAEDARMLLHDLDLLAALRVVL